MTARSARQLKNSAGGENFGVASKSQLYLNGIAGLSFLLALIKRESSEDISETKFGKTRI